jgi:DMSO/TMAO reductase YedYZ molybdopterin-dependent catalytic subunit
VYAECECVEKTRFQKTLPYLIVLAVIVALVALIAVGSYSSPPTLYPGEVRNYEGQNLSAIADVQINAVAGVQHINQSNYTLTVDGLVNQTLRLSYNDVVNGFSQYQKVVTIYCVEGWDAKILWEGNLVMDLLDRAGVNASAKVAIFYASDGYSTALPLDYLRSHNILLAYKMNQVVLPDERGWPFMLVSESQYGYKWIKWITHIEVSDNANYLGYWESRGYPNNATLR